MPWTQERVYYFHEAKVFIITNFSLITTFSSRKLIPIFSCIMSPHASQGATTSGGEGKAPSHWAMGNKAFEHRMPHHDGIEALWETRWKLPVSIMIELQRAVPLELHPPITPDSKPSARH